MTLHMAFIVLPLQASDIAACVTIYFAAFQNAHSLGCWPRTPNIRAWWEQMIHDELREPGAHWLKAIAKDTGEITGFAKWQEPNPGVEPDIDLPEWPADADAALCNETFGAWVRAHRDLMGRRGHWYLEIVATDPAFQGKGAGSLMMKYGLDKADADGTECFLEASPDAVPLYQRAGFREAGRIDTLIENERVKATWYRNVFMIRPVRDTHS